MLEIRDLETGYEKKQVVFGFSLDVGEREIVGLIGPNGAGKSTVLRAISGVIPTWRGEVRLYGVSTRGATVTENLTRGMAFLPQGNRVFPGLTVSENLRIGGLHLQRRELADRIDSLLSVFPVLRERSKEDAGKLSGGEQQMVAFARALIPRPKLLLLDEPSLGLSPALVRSALSELVRIRSQEGVGILVVEQNVREVLRICDRVCSMRLGKVAFCGSCEELTRSGDRLKELFL